MTEKYYFIDMLCFETTANIVALDDEKSSVILDKTIFHVKGGGQLADSGTIDNAIVLNVTHGENGAILHQLSKEDLQKLSVNLNVTLKIDSVKRRYHSRLHSAGHIIAGVVEKLFPELKAISGNHIPGQSRIVFSGQLLLDKEEFISETSKELKLIIGLNKPVIVKKGKENLRFIDIKDCNESACGGTHVSWLSEIGEITIRKVSTKPDQVSLSYEINE